MVSVTHADTSVDSLVTRIEENGWDIGTAATELIRRISIAAFPGVYELEEFPCADIDVVNAGATSDAQIINYIEGRGFTRCDPYIGLLYASTKKPSDFTARKVHYAHVVTTPIKLPRIERPEKTRDYILLLKPGGRVPVLLAGRYENIPKHTPNSLYLFQRKA